jgi:conjugative transfer region protein TrbK
MDGKSLARIGTIVLVAIAFTATLIEMTRKDGPERGVGAPATSVMDDPLREDLRRCQLLGEAAASDPECLATWAQNRDRFLGRDPSEAR